MQLLSEKYIKFEFMKKKKKKKILIKKKMVEFPSSSWPISQKIKIKLKQSLKYIYFDVNSILISLHLA